MKNLFFVFTAVVSLSLFSCGNNTGSTAVKDSVSGTSPDSTANNGILPPSAAPGDAGNSSLADSTYKSRDSNKIHKDTSGLKK